MLRVTMMHNGDVSFYPKAGLIKLGQALYSMRHIKIEDSFWLKFMTNLSKVVHQKRMERWHCPVDSGARGRMLTIYYAHAWSGGCRLWAE